MRNATLQSEKEIEQFVESLYLNYRSLIMKVAYKYVLNAAVAEDILQDTFVQIIRKAEFLRTMEKYKLEAYLILMVRGLSVDYLRKNHCVDQVDVTDEVLLSMIGQQAVTYEQPANEFKKAELFLMINKLPPEDQFLLIGRYYLEMSIRELVTYMGGTETGMRSKVLRARKRAFKTWKEYGLSMEDFLNE